MRAKSGVERCFMIAINTGLVFACAYQRAAPPVAGSGAGVVQAPSDTITRAQDSSDDAANVVRAYDQAINERRYPDAYRLWASEGAAGGRRSSAATRSAETW